MLCLGITIYICPVLILYYHPYAHSTMETNLKWDDHINNMIPKISAKIGFLRSLRNIVPTDTLTQIYNAIVQPHLDYGDAVYDSASQTSKYRLQKLQTRAVRLIMGSGPHTSRNLIFNKLKWLSLQQRRDFHKYILVYKCRMGLAPQYLFDMFIANNSNHSCNTRNATQLIATITRTAYYYCSFTVSDLNLWNSLPYHIKECASLSRPPSMQSFCYIWLGRQPWLGFNLFSHYCPYHAQIKFIVLLRSQICYFSNLVHYPSIIMSNLITKSCMFSIVTIQSPYLQPCERVNCPHFSLHSSPVRVNSHFSLPSSLVSQFSIFTLLQPCEC